MSLIDKLFGNRRKERVSNEWEEKERRLREIAERYPEYVGLRGKDYPQDQLILSATPGITIKTTKCGNPIGDLRKETVSNMRLEEIGDPTIANIELQEFERGYNLSLGYFSDLGKELKQRACYTFYWDDLEEHQAIILDYSCKDGYYAGNEGKRIIVIFDKSKGVDPKTYIKNLIDKCIQEIYRFTRYEMERSEAIIEWLIRDREISLKRDPKKPRNDESCYPSYFINLLEKTRKSMDKVEEGEK